MPKRLTTEEFIEKTRQVHGDKYDYSKVEYKTSGEKVCIICKEHGEFWQIPENHLHKHHAQGCPKCSHGHDKYTIEEFIEKARQVHGDKYDYSKVEYSGKDIKVCITCPIHGDFWQLPSVHVYNKSGCPRCKSSKLENEFASFLDKNNIDYVRQKRFQWLGKQSLDFFLPKHGIAIECQGEQHFSEISFGNTDDLKHRLEYYQKLDKQKKELCETNNIRLLYFAKKKYDDTILTKEEILEEIT